jgi:glutamate decarboxylase
VPRAYDEYDLSDRLKESGWVLPAYTMAPNAKSVKLLRAVIR